MKFFTINHKPEKVDLRKACHFLIDMMPESGLDEVLEKLSDIHEYHCSLTNYSHSVPESVEVPINPEISSYEREPFSYSE